MCIRDSGEGVEDGGGKEAGGQEFNRLSGHAMAMAMAARVRRPDLHANLLQPRRHNTRAAV